MNKKRFAILMVIALILSSFTFAYANNSGGNNEKKNDTGNRKIHVHLEANRDDISQVFIVIDDEEIELKASGKSGNYTVSKGGDLVSNTLGEIRIVYTSDEDETFSPANKYQQGQEGQGSINYRITVTETIENDVDIIDVTIDTEEEETEEEVVNETEKEEDLDLEEDSVEEEEEESDTVGGGTVADESNENDLEGSSDIDGDTEDMDLIQIVSDQTPLGIVEPQEISSTEETPVETEIKTETLDLEDEETPLDIPSTGVATPLFYGAGALISLVGLLKRR